MTTYVNFVPSTAAPFQFQCSLDGAVYNVIVTWLLFGARFYINVYALDGTLIASKALVGSPTGVQIQSLSWGVITRLVTVTTAVPHGYRIGTTIGLTIAGSAPDAYNGKFDCLINGTFTFTYPLSSDPGMATVCGSANYDLNIVGRYFTTSSLVFREPANQFEISP
jgi:hypothetical protein